MAHWQDMASSALEAAIAAFGEDVDVSFVSPPSAATVRGMFRRAWESDDAFRGDRVDRTRLVIDRDTPVVVLHRGHLVQEPVRGDRVTARGQLYEATEVRQDGEQGRVLILREVPT